MILTRQGQTLNVKKAVIPIAGKGTRFLPATKSLPKEMIPIISRPMIDYVIDEVIDSGIEEVIFVTSASGEKRITEDFYKPNPELEKFLETNNKQALKQMVQALGNKIKTSSVIQHEQLGLGHAIATSEQLVGTDEAFAVLLPDDLTLGHNQPVTSQLLDIYKQYESSVIGVMKVPEDKVHFYGVIDYSEKLSDRLFVMKDMVEKPSRDKAPSFLATPGRYILKTEIFEHLKNIPRGAGGEYQLTDAISSLSQKDKVYALEFKGDRYDTGNIEGYLKATIDFALKDPKLAEVLKKHIHEVL